MSPGGGFLNSSLAPCPNHPLVTHGLGACGRCGQAFCGDCLVQLGGLLTCAGCKLGRLSELRSGTADLELQLAGRGRRFTAASLDSLLFLGPWFALYVSGLLYSYGPHFGRAPSAAELARAGIHQQRGVWLPVLCSFLLLFCGVLYEAWMLAARGQTLGKMAVGIKVVTPQGGDIRAGQAWVRALSGTLMALVYLNYVDDLFIFTPRRRTLHDRLAKTVVVKWRR